jgi:hypothetical protein
MFVPVFTRALHCSEGNYSILKYGWTLKVGGIEPGSSGIRCPRQVCPTSEPQGQVDWMAQVFGYRLATRPSTFVFTPFVKKKKGID